VQGHRIGERGHCPLPEAEDSTPDPHGKAMFKTLGREEEGHLALLEEELEWVTKYRKYCTLHRFSLRTD